jgi:hypothetical protein
MGAHNNSARQGDHRQAIREVFEGFPADLLASIDDTEEPRGYQAPAPVAVEDQAAQRRGWLGLARRQNAARPEPAADRGLHLQAFEIERRAQRLDDALATAREHLSATTGELHEVRRRLARTEADLAAERATGAEWQATAAELNEHIDALRAELEQLQHEHAALAAVYADEEQARHQFEHVAGEQMPVLDELRGQLSTVTAELQTEHEAHGQTLAYATGLEHQLTTLHAQWEAHAQELTDTIVREREDHQRTIEDERHSAEQARAEQAFQHREEIERAQAEATSTINAVELSLADAQATLEATSIALGATRADVSRLTEDVEATRGEALAANTRAREADELRLRAEQRIEELGDELDYVRAEVMGSVDRNKKRGLLRRKPAPVKAAADKPSRAVGATAQDGPAAPVDPDVEDIIERRLFGNA